MDERDESRGREAAEELSRAARESYMAAVDRAFEAQKGNMRLSRRFFENWIETLENHAELNRRTVQDLTEIVREQREVYRALSGESLDAYEGVLDSLTSYYEDVSKETEVPENKRGRSGNVDS